MLNQLVRFEPVLRLLGDLGGGTVLDVGSGSRGLASWLGPPWEATAVDASFEDYGGASGPARDGVRRILGDARALPFADQSFDVVVALDLVEHLEAGDRPTALRELSRVARRRVIVGCPAGAAALAADRRLADVLERRGQEIPVWLAEHLEHGFPEPADLATALGAFGPVRLLGNENARTHELTMRIETRRPGDRASRALGAVAARLGAGFVTGRVGARALWLARGRDRPPTYRTIAVADRSS